MTTVDYPTTRCYPRTLADAFPDERASCIEGPDPAKSMADTVVAVSLWFAGIFLCVLLALPYLRLAVL